MSAARPGGARRRRWRDPRVAFGLAVTGFFLWLSLRGVPFAEVARAIARAHWGVLLGLSIPSYLLLVWLRALRWRHLTDPICPIGTGPLFRATAVGFLANNVFPLRMGEVVRSWYLARETGASGAALFGSVILERVVDTVSVIALVFVVIAVFGSGGDDTLQRGALLLAPLAVVPIVVLALLRAAPERVIALARLLMRPLPARIAARLEEMLRRFSEGLGALRGGRHLGWIAWHSAVIWLGVSVVPIVAVFLALDLDFGGPGQALAAAWVTQAAIGAAVALPSAPGFFGIFHFACRVALVRFGVAAETAVAAGTLIHSVMWLTLTGMGLVVLRGRSTGLGELEAVVEEGAGPAGR